VKDAYKEEIITVDGMPCINLSKPIRGNRPPPGLFIIRTRTIIPDHTGLAERTGTKKDFTQLQNEKTQMFMREILDEIRKHGWIFF